MSTNVLLEKPAVKPTKKILTVDSKNTIRNQFAKWLYKETTNSEGLPNGRIISIDRCATEIHRLTNGERDIKESHVRSYISDAREYFEENLNCTIWPVYGHGWRASTKVETARYCGKSIRKTIAWADRTRRLIAITERKYIPYALREVAGAAGDKIQNLAGYRKKFLQMWGVYQQDEEKKLEAMPEKQKLLPTTTL